MWRFADIALLAVRLLLAFVFLLAGAAKLLDPAGLRRSWLDFGLPALFARAAVLLLPLLELAAGILLIPAASAWYGAWGALGLLCAFLLVVGVAVVRGRKPDCRCFGQVHSSPVGWPTLVRDGVLAACAGWLVWEGPLHSGPDLGTWFASLNTHEKKLALLGAAAVVFVFLRLLDRARPKPADAEPEDDFVPDSEEEAPRERARPARGPAAPPRQPPAEETPMPPGPNGIGLPLGTSAPDFELPAVSGEKRSLLSLRIPGRDLLLVFSSPYCEPCHKLAPKLVRWAGEMQPWFDIAVISRGSPADNLAKLKGFEASRILLQREFEISEAYDCIATPSAVMVGADGLIRTELAVGIAPVTEMVSSWAKRAQGLVEPTSDPVS